MARQVYIGIIADNIIVTSGISVIEPYYSRGYSDSGSLEPCITIESSGDLGGAASLSDDANVVTFGCAINENSSTVAPTDYDSFRRCAHAILGNTDGENKYVITLDDSGLPISGNATYDVYGLYAVIVRDQVYATSIMNVSGVRTRAPYPHIRDFELSAPETGGIVVGDTQMQQFNFKFDTLDNFANTDQFGVSYEDAATSGLIQLSCSGELSTEDGGNDTWYNPDGSTQDTAYYQLIPDLDSDASGVWVLPKYRSSTEDTYQGYIFYANYVNSSGIIGPSMELGYRNEVLRDFHEKSVFTTDGGQPRQWENTTPHAVVVEGITHRKRLAFGIKDIDLESITYKDTGSYISKPFGIEIPLYAVTLDASEQFPGQEAGTFDKWNYVKYYVQFGSTMDGEWHRISLKSRIKELDDAGNTVPSVIILDSMMTEDEKRGVEPIYGKSLYVSMGRPVRTFRIKVEVSTINSPNTGSWSPFIYDYKVGCLTRDALTSALIERHLFE